MSASALPDGPDREAGGRLRRDLEERIRSGEWPPGHRLPGERALAVQAGVSRPVVREVLRSLSAQGVVVVSPARGAFVRRPGTGDAAPAVARLIAARGATVRDVARARQVLEAEAAQLAAEHGGGGALPRLLRLAGAVDDGEDLLEQARTDLDFHVSLSLAAGNPVLLAMHRAIAPHVLGMMLRRKRRPDSAGDPWVLHREIAAAVEGRQADRARALMLEHLAATADAFGEDFDRPVLDVAREDLRGLVGSAVPFEQVADEVLARLDVALDDHETADPDAGAPHP